LAHALHEPCYIVEPHPPGIELPPNGLPVFVLNYENDDESHHRFGRDSQLTFVAPADGQYLVRVWDVRGIGGPEFKYQLSVRPPRPDFVVKTTGQDHSVPVGAGRKFGIELQRIDGFDGPVRLDIAGMPPGFSVTTPIVVEAGQDRAWGTIWADEGAAQPADETAGKTVITATATIQERLVEREVGSLGKIKLGEKPTVLVELRPDRDPGQTTGEAAAVIEIRPGTTTTATVSIRRQGHDGRVGFGGEEAAFNAPHGVYVDNIGLNGVLIVEGDVERQFFLTAEPWVPPMERWIFVESDVEGTPTSRPALLRVLPALDPTAAGIPAAAILGESSSGTQDSR
jgi:hypothetical protein